MLAHRNVANFRSIYPRQVFKVNTNFLLLTFRKSQREYSVFLNLINFIYTYCTPSVITFKQKHVLPHPRFFRKQPTSPIHPHPPPPFPATTTQPSLTLSMRLQNALIPAAPLNCPGGSMRRPLINFANSAPSSLKASARAPAARAKLSAAPVSGGDAEQMFARRCQRQRAGFFARNNVKARQPGAYNSARTRRKSGQRAPHCFAALSARRARLVNRRPIMTFARDALSG